MGGCFFYKNMGCFGARKAPRSPLGKYFYVSFGGCEATQRIFSRTVLEGVQFSCIQLSCISCNIMTCIYLQTVIKRLKLRII